MTFTVTYRGADGALREERVEAANRAECFAQMKAQGIAPMSVKEGAPKGVRKPAARTGVPPVQGGGRNGQDARCPSRRVVPYVLAVAFIALLTGGLWWWMRRDGGIAPNQQETPKKPAPAKEVKPAGAPTLAPSSGTAPTAASRTAVPEVATASAHQTTTNVAAKTPSWPPPPVERDERGRVIPPPGAITLDEQNSIFERNSDAYIAMLVSPRPGTALPPMPQPSPAMEEDFLESLSEPIEIGPDDSPEDRAIKLAVTAARVEIKRLLDQGVKFADIVREHETLLKENTEIREKALSEYRAIKKSGDEKGAEQYFKTINIALQQMGVAPMTKSTSHEEVRARMLETRTRREQEGTGK